MKFLLTFALCLLCLSGFSQGAFRADSGSFGTVGASSSLDGNGVYNIFTNAAGNLQTNWWGRHGGFGGRDYFGNFYVISTNGYIQYSNAASGIRVQIRTTPTNTEITSFSPTSTNAVHVGTNRISLMFDGVRKFYGSNDGTFFATTFSGAVNVAGLPNSVLTNSATLSGGNVGVTNTTDISNGRNFYNTGTLTNIGAGRFSSTLLVGTTLTVAGLSSFLSAIGVSGNISSTGSGQFNGNGSGLTNLYGIRSGFTNIPTLTASMLITFTTPMPVAVGTNYWVGITFDSTLAALNTPSATAKTTNGFTLTLQTAITGAQPVDYYAAPYQ